MVLRIVVGAPAVVVYLLEVGLGHLADLRPTAPSLATLAVDRQALLLDKEAPNQFLTSPPLLACEGVVVMVTRSLPLKSSPSLLGNGRDGGHAHTHPSSEKISPSSGKRSEEVVMVMNILPLKSSLPLLGNGRGGGHGHTHPSPEKLSSCSGEGKGWWSRL